MTRQFQMTVEPLWKLAGVSLLLLSFIFTTWMLTNAAIAADHLVDVLVDFCQDATAIFRPHTHGLFAG